jgi:hypothetical protein
MTRLHVQVIALLAAPLLAPLAQAQQGQSQQGQSQQGEANPLPVLTLCIAPVPPPQYDPASLPADPPPPKCLNLEKNTSTCTDRVLNEWNAKSKAQNDLKRARVSEINTYLRDLQKYQNTATDYAQCEQERVSRLLPN